jgi:hypothetical protein
VQTAATEIVAANLGLLAVPHNDGQPNTPAGNAISLQYFLDFPAALKRFTSICEILPKGSYIELWNEADYSGAEAGTFGLSWGSVVTLYENATQLRDVARANQLKIVLPAPLDQSPEQTVEMQQNGAFPWEQMAAIGADYLSYHVYDVAGGLPFRTRLKSCTDTAAELGLPLFVTETNFGPDVWKIVNVEKEYVSQKIVHCIYQYVMNPPSTSDFSNSTVLSAIKAGHAPVSAIATA